MEKKILFFFAADHPSPRTQLHMNSCLVYLPSLAPSLFPYCFTISPEPTLFSVHLFLRANTRTRQAQRLNLCACWAHPAPLSSSKATKYTTTSQTQFILTRAFGWSCLFACSIPSPAFCLYSLPALIPIDHHFAPLGAHSHPRSITPDTPTNASLFWTPPTVSSFPFVWTTQALKYICLLFSTKVARRSQAKGKASVSAPLQ